MNNWTYAQDIPTSDLARRADPAPRTFLSRNGTWDPLRQEPIAELQSLRGENWSWEKQNIPGGSSSLLAEVEGETLEIIAEFEVGSRPQAIALALKCVPASGEETVIGYATKGRTVFVDRSHSGSVDFSPEFSGIHTAELLPIDDTIRLHIFVDRSSLEVFGNDGLVSFSERIFPDPQAWALNYL